MGTLRNARHEAFAQALARGLSQCDAAAAVGYVRDTGTASKLANRPDVAARVAELQGRVASTVVVTRAWVLEKLVENVEAAMNEKSRGAANRGLELIGKELGMFVERAEVGRPGDFDRMDDDELERAYLAALAAERLALPSPSAGEDEAEPGAGIPD